MTPTIPNNFSRFSILTPTHLAYLATLTTLAGLPLIGLELLQVLSLPTSPGVGGSLELLRSEIFVVVAIAATGLGLCLLPLGRLARRALLGVVHLFALFVVFANVVGHFFFQATGSALNWPLLVHGFGALVESPEVILSEVPAVGWVVLVVSLFVVAVGPLVAAGVVRRRTGESSSGEPAARPRFAIVCLVAAVVSVLVAAIPATWLDYDVGVSRDAGLHLLITAFGGGAAGPADGVSPHFDIAEIRVEPPEDLGEDGPQNVAVIILESVRASATTPHNPELDTTPYLDELADNSLFFEHAYAVVPHTSKALVAILCGVPPRIIMQIAESQPAGTPGRCMPTMLADHGYRSLFMQAATEQFENRRGLVANMGYDDFIPLEEMDTDGYEAANYFGVEDDVMLPYSDDWLAGVDDAPFFTTYLTITPHHDYQAPRTYGRFDFHHNDVFNRYLNSVRYIDHFVENLIDQYKERGLYDSTLFVIVGDHGEAFGEHGREQHDNVPWQEGVHIPLMIHDGSGTIEPDRIEDTVSHVDIAPTVFELLDFEVTDGNYPGYALSALIPERFAHFSCWYDDQCAGMVHRQKKFIHHFGNRPDELFDLAEDPNEQNNLIGDDERAPAELIERLFYWMDSIDVAYQNVIDGVINRRVLATPPPIEHEADKRVGDAVEVVGYGQASSSAGTSAPEVILRVLRDFQPDDEIGLVVHYPSGRSVAHTPMRGIYPPLFWQEGQILVDPLPVAMFDGEQPDRLELVVNGERVELDGALL